MPALLCLLSGLFWFLLSFVIYIRLQSEGFTLHDKQMLTELIGLTLDIPINSSKEKSRQQSLLHAAKLTPFHLFSP